MKAIDVGKIIAIDAGKKLVEKAAKNSTTAKSQVATVMFLLEEITTKLPMLLPSMLIQVRLILTK